MADKTKKTVRKRGYGFGTAPVFLTSVCAIMGAIMFLRFGFALGHVGLLYALLIIVLGHAITIPTGLAVSEIATNLRVGGGGEYFMISRSFGPRIGGTIGVMLYAAQAISVSFYIIGFTEGVKPLVPFIQEQLLDRLPFGMVYDPRMISIPLGLVMFTILLTRGANIGIKLLYVIFAGMMAGVAVFMISPSMAGASSGITETTANPLPFITVFAIVFPAFTGMTAGVGLSGDLKDPGKSIPKGIMIAIGMGFFVYLAMIIKLYLSAPTESLASNNLIIYDLAKGITPNINLGAVILIGLFGATLSSAVGFALIAPRTLQALSGDKIIPNRTIMDFLKFGRGRENEPTNAMLISSLIAMVFLFLGDLNAVAQIITMFFLITYGSVCLISFMEHFAGNPSYRPTFKTRWYISLVGAVLCFGVMFQFSPIYAIVTLLIMGGIYLSLGYRHKRSRSFAIIFQGVMFQLARFMKINLQRTMSKPDKFNWRPSVIAITTDAKERASPKDVLRWISHHYGFGTLLHLTIGKLDKDTLKASKRIEKGLIREMRMTKANYSVATLVSPSMLTAVAQTVQISGISGLDNNTIMFEFNQNRTEELTKVMEGIRTAMAASFNTLVLRSTEHYFGTRRSIDLWIMKDDFRNVNLMILLAYIILEHQEWSEADITIHTLFPRGEKAQLAKRVKMLISKGRLPISVRSVRSYSYDSEDEVRSIIKRRSNDSDLTIMGFTLEEIEKEGSDIFTRYPIATDTLFVSAVQDIVIV